MEGNNSDFNTNNSITTNVVQFSKGLNLTSTQLGDVMKMIRESGYLHTADKISTSLQYDVQHLAGRMLVFYINKITPNTVAEYVKLNRGKSLRDPICDFMLENATKIEQAIAIGHENDSLHAYFGANTLRKQYLLRLGYDASTISENIQYFYMRVAVEFYHKRSIDEVISVYMHLSKQLYTHATPTLLNSGSRTNQLASCFLLTIDDHLQDILYTGVGDVGMISRYNGGIGIDISRLRHSEIGNDGQSKGISPVLHLYNAVTRYVDQGGKRNGAETVFLRTHHYDFPEFVKSIEKTGDKYDRNHDIHISGWTSWLFWERVASDKEWTLFCPNKTKDLNDLYGEEFNTRYVQYEIEAKQLKDAYSKCKTEVKELEKDPLYIENPLYRQKNIELADLTKKQINYRTMPARELLKLMTEVQMHSEGPFIMNGDSANFKSNHRHRGYIRSSNLCQEIVEYTDKNEIASCNLASISLKMFCVKPVNHIILLNANSTEIMAHLRECYDFNTLGNIVRWIVMNLNMVIDNNFYPLDEFDSKTGQITKRGKIATTNYKSRPLGIGVSGFSDMLARLDLPFCKDDKGREIHPAVELLNKMVFACIEFNGLIKSCELALTHGPYETFIHEDKKCPYAEGKFQHDLWADEYKVLEKLRSESGIKRNWVRKPEDDIPVSPSDWGQHRIVITGVRDSEHTVISVSTEIEPSWESLRKNIVLHGIYNSLITALMPTASTSQIIGNCESTEAHMSIVYAREVKSGFYIITNEYLCRDLQSIGLLKDDILNNIRNNWDGTLSGIVDYVAKTYKDFKDFDRLNHIRRKYMTAYELSNRIFMKMASDRGRYVDQSQSLNVFLPKVSTEALSALLYYGYDLGLKTVMYYLYQKKFSSIAKFGELAAITNDSKVDTKLESKIESKLESDVKVSETKNIVESDSLALTPAEICRRDALTGKKICEMCT
jgi:ribonucleoside-diphosphate reductase alpha chain